MLSADVLRLAHQLWVSFWYAVSAQAIIYHKAMKKLNEKDLFAWWWLLDIWMFIYYCIFAPALWKKPKKNWH